MKVLLAIFAIGLLALYANAAPADSNPKYLVPRARIPFYTGICKNQPLGKNMPYCYDAMCSIGDCAKFVQCAGAGVAKECPPGTHFNVKIQVCDWIQSANCPW